MFKITETWTERMIRMNGLVGACGPSLMKSHNSILQRRNVRTRVYGIATCCTANEWKRTKAHCIPLLLLCYHFRPPAPTHLLSHPPCPWVDSHYCDSMPQAEQLAFNELSHRKWPTSLFLKVTFIISRIILILFEGFLAMMC